MSNKIKNTNQNQNQKQSISFYDIKNFIGRGVIFMGVTDDPSFTPETVTKLFKDFNFNNTVTEIRKIDGNVKGENGRTDWLLIFNKSIKGIRPFALMQDVKWIEDFIDNYGKDYGFYGTSETI